MDGSWCDRNYEFLGPRQNSALSVHLFEACRSGRHQLIRELPEGAYFAEVCFKTQFSPLRLAVENGCIKTCEALLNRLQSMPDAIYRTALAQRDSRGASPLLVACENGRLDIAELLLRAGADPFCRLNDDSTIAHHLAFSGQYTALHWLLSDPTRREQLLEARDRDGATPLFYACSSGVFSCTSELVGCGADPLAVNSSGQTILFTIVSSLLHPDSFLGWLFNFPLKDTDQAALINTKDLKGRTVMFSACGPNGNLEACKLFHRHGADLTVVDNEGISLAHAVAVRGETPMTQWFFSELNETDAFRLATARSNVGVTPLGVLITAKTMTAKSLRTLMLAGAASDEKDCVDALVYASKTGNNPAVKTLLLCGAAPQAIVHRQELRKLLETHRQSVVREIERALPIKALARFTAEFLFLLPSGRV